MLPLMMAALGVICLFTGLLEAGAIFLVGSIVCAFFDKGQEDAYKAAESVGYTNKVRVMRIGDFFINLVILAVILLIGYVVLGGT